MPYGNQDAFFESVSAVTTTNTVELGTRRTEGENDYIYVYNNGASDINPGHGATVSALTGYSVTVSSVTSINPCIGVCMHTTFTTATYGWLVTKGIAVVEATANTGIAVGDALVLGTDGVHTRLTGATGYFFPAHAYAVAATASGGSSSAFIHCFGA